MKFLNLFLEHAIDGDKDLAKAALRKVIAEKSARIVNEDHERIMTVKEMASHLKGLWKRADSEDKKLKFLSQLAEAAGAKECTDKDITSLADKICAKGAKNCDNVIHALEKLVGVEKPVTESEKFDKASFFKKKSKSEKDEDDSDDEDEDDEDEKSEKDDEDEDEKSEKKGKKSKSKKDDDDSDDDDEDEEKSEKSEKKDDKPDFFKKKK